MSKLRVESFTISLDGFGAGPQQDLQNPLGVGGTALHAWAFATRTFQQHVFGGDGGSAEGVDEAFAARGFENVGAWILGRNIFRVKVRDARGQGLDGRSFSPCRCMFGVLGCAWKGQYRLGM